MMEGEDTAAMEEGKGRGGTSGGRNTKLHSYISYSKCNLCNLGVNLGASALYSLNLICVPKKSQPYLLAQIETLAACGLEDGCIH